MQDNYYKEISNWSRNTSAQLRRATSRFRKGKKVFSRKKIVNLPDGRSFEATELKLNRSVTSKVKKKFGIPDFVQFRYAYHGIFLRKGLGKGNRTADDFLVPIMNNNIPKLADIAADNAADSAVNAIFL